MELLCEFCKRLLCHQNAGGAKMDGYYVYLNKAYCSDCWTSIKSEDYVSCSDSKP